MNLRPPDIPYAGEIVSTRTMAFEHEYAVNEAFALHDLLSAYAGQQYVGVVHGLDCVEVIFAGTRRHGRNMLTIYLDEQGKPTSHMDGFVAFPVEYVRQCGVEVQLRAYCDELRQGGGDPDVLRAILDELRERGGVPDATLFVANGACGADIIDTRGHPPGGWVVERVLPTGVVAAVADLDDPPPDILLEHGFDVVQLLETRGQIAPGAKVLRVFFHPSLGLCAPAPMWIRLGEEGWDKA